MNPLTDIIPATWRKPIYGLYALAGVVLGALQVAEVTMLGTVSLERLWDVYAYVGVPLGATAFSNVITKPESAPQPILVQPLAYLVEKQPDGTWRMTADAPDQLP